MELNKIVLTLGDGFSSVSPIVPQEIIKLLTYWHKTLVWDPKTNKRATKGESRKLYCIHDAIDKTTKAINQNIVFPFGLTSKVLSKLKSLDYEIETNDIRTAPLTPEYEKAIYGLREYQIEGTLAMLAAGGGIMHCPTGWGKTHIMHSIIRAFDPEQLKLRKTPTIVVTAPDKDIVRSNYLSIKDIFKDRDVGCVMSGIDKPSDDIVVVTMDSLHRIEPEEVGILLVDEVHTIATSTRAEYVTAMTKAMKWGFSATPGGRFDNADLLTEGLIGPVVYFRSYTDGINDGALVPITVVWLDCPEPNIGAARVQAYNAKIHQLRHGVFRNTNKNNNIIAILNAIEDRQTLCITTSLDQVNALVGLKPTLVYVHGTTDTANLEESKYFNIKGIKKKEREEIYDKVVTGEIRQIASTNIYQQGVNFPGLEVLINCGGGGSDIAAGQIPGRASRNITGKDRSYIVDFWHNWDLITTDTGRKRPGFIHADDVSRKDVYDSLGFTSIHVHSVDEAVNLIKGKI